MRPGSNPYVRRRIEIDFVRLFRMDFLVWIRIDFEYLYDARPWSLEAIKHPLAKMYF